MLLALPYKARVIQAVPHASGGLALTIAVVDANGVVRSQTQNIFRGSLQDTGAVKGLLQAMRDAVMTQLQLDSGDLATALTAISVSYGG